METITEAAYLGEGQGQAGAMSPPPGDSTSILRRKERGEEVNTAFVGEWEITELNLIYFIIKLVDTILMGCT